MFDGETKSARQDFHRKIFEQYYNYVYAIVFNKLRSIASAEDIEDCIGDIFSDIYIYYSKNEKYDDIKGFVSTISERKAVIWLVGYSVKIYQFYKLSGLDAPIQSITDFVNFPVTLKVWQYLALIYILRTIAVIVSALIMLYISSKCKNTTMSVLVNFAVFALPIIVYLLGANIMVNIGMNPFLSVNAVMNWIYK